MGFLFFSLCDVVASRSKDLSSKIGSVIVGPNNEIRSTGYNSFPKGINDNVPERYERPEKYIWTEHAERNAIYNAARVGTPTDNCSLYCYSYPCMDCARAIVQAGIKRVVIKKNWLDDKPGYAERWGEMFKKTIQLFAEAKISLEEV